MALAGSTEISSTKKRGDLQKTKLKVMDMGPEANGGDLYWIDFLGEGALSDEELDAILRQPVVIEVRRIYISTGNQPGRSYLNASGGAGATERTDRPAGLTLAATGTGVVAVKFV